MSAPTRARPATAPTTAPAMRPAPAPDFLLLLLEDPFEMGPPFCGLEVDEGTLKTVADEGSFAEGSAILICWAHAIVRYG